MLYFVFKQLVNEVDNKREQVLTGYLKLLSTSGDLLYTIKRQGDTRVRGVPIAQCSLPFLDFILVLSDSVRSQVAYKARKHPIFTLTCITVYFRYSKD